MSATIYEFPARGRYAVGGQGEQAQSAAINFAPSSFVSPRNNVKTVLGNGWYHDDAIAEETLRKN